MTSFITAAISKSAETIGVSESKFKNLVFLGGACVAQGTIVYYNLNHPGYLDASDLLDVSVGLLGAVMTATGLVMAFDS